MANIKETTIKIIELSQAEMEIIDKEGVVLIEPMDGLIAIKLKR